MTDEAPAQDDADETGAPKQVATSRSHFWLGDEDLGILDEEQISTADMMALEMNANMTIKELFQGFREMRGRAWVAMVWFLRFKQGKPVHINAIEPFNFTDLRRELLPDPTKAPHGSGETATSAPSPSSSDSPRKKSTRSASATSSATSRTSRAGRSS